MTPTTVDEISDAMEKVFGRHRAEIKSITGVYKREASTMGNRVEKVQAMIDAFVQSALMLLLGFAMLRGAAIDGLSLVSQQVVNLWFVRRRGIAAAASLGLAADSFVFPKLIDGLITLTRAGRCRSDPLPGKALPHLETSAKQLIFLEANAAIFSKRSLESLNNQTGFDSAIRRFDPSRPSQKLRFP
ncbi:hypothetical protein [Bradyrhizobium sp. USDA 223]|uniref:hypothetical protein n=1 Tax=Bradyrhizobium sp. USDA 223 TaxID=3156306 RepID=UPI003835BDC2